MDSLDKGRDKIFFEVSVNWSVLDWTGRPRKGGIKDDS